MRENGWTKKPWSLCNSIDPDSVSPSLARNHLRAGLTASHGLTSSHRLGGKDARLADGRARPVCLPELLLQ